MKALFIILIAFLVGCHSQKKANVGLRDATPEESAIFNAAMEQYHDTHIELIMAHDTLILNSKRVRYIKFGGLVYEIGDEGAIKLTGQITFLSKNPIKKLN